MSRGILPVREGGEKGGFFACSCAEERGGVVGDGRGGAEARSE